MTDAWVECKLAELVMVPPAEGVEGVTVPALVGKPWWWSRPLVEGAVLVVRGLAQAQEKHQAALDVRVTALTDGWAPLFVRVVGASWALLVMPRFDVQAVASPTVWNASSQDMWVLDESRNRALVKWPPRKAYGSGAASQSESGLRPDTTVNMEHWASADRRRVVE